MVAAFGALLMLDSCGVRSSGLFQLYRRDLYSKRDFLVDNLFRVRLCHKRGLFFLDCGSEPRKPAPSARRRAEACLVASDELQNMQVLEFLKFDCR